MVKIKNKLLGSVKNINGNKVRIYSLFTTGMKWFKRCYYSCRKKYYLKTLFEKSEDFYVFYKKKQSYLIKSQDQLLKQSIKKLSDYSFLLL